MLPYTPSYEVKDSHNPFYRGCWHEFSLCLNLFYIHYIQIYFKVYDNKAIIPYGVLLDRTKMHCPIFPTAANIVFGHFFKPVVADHSSKPAKHIRLNLAFNINKYHNIK